MRRVVVEKTLMNRKRDGADFGERIIFDGGLNVDGDDSLLLAARVVLDKVKLRSGQRATYAKFNAFLPDKDAFVLIPGPFSFLFTLNSASESA